MKSTGFLASFLLIFFLKIIHGQHNGLLQNQNIESNNVLQQQQQPSNTLLNSIQRYLNQNGNTGALPNKIDHNQVQIQKNILPSLTNSQQRQQPSDINQKPQQLQQVVQQQQPLQGQQSLQVLQPLQTQPILQSQESLHQILQSQLPIQEIQQPLSLQQNNQKPVSGIQQNVDLFQPSSIQQHNFPSTGNLNLQLQPFKVQDTKNVGTPLNSQNLIVQPPNNLKDLVEVINTPQQASFSSQDVLSTVYYGSPQQSPALVSSHNPSIALIPSYNIKPTEQTYVPPYNYIKPSTERQASVVDEIKAMNSVPALSTVLTIPSVQSANVQTYYYNSPIANPRQNLYINQNSQFQYPQTNMQVTPVQTQSAAVIPSQSSILSSVPLSVQSQFPQYGISSVYPVNSIVAPAYTSKKSKTSNLKSLLPLIFNLLREKIASCDCQNSCPCDCKNKSIGNELEVSGGYSSLKNYGALKEDAISVINTALEEFHNPECLRERKNLKTEKVIPEISEETIEEDDDSEEEVEDDEEED